MSSFVVSEALVTGVKEAFKLWLVWLVINSFFLGNAKKGLSGPFLAGLLSSLLVALLPLFAGANLFPGETVANLIYTSFAFFLLSGVAALLAVSVPETSLFLEKALHAEGVLKGSAFICAILFFFPDYLGSIIYLRELSLLKEKALLTVVSAAGGIVVCSIIFVSIARRIRPEFIAGFLDLPQILLFLSIVKLFGGGTRGLSEISLLPAVQKGLMKFSHDFVHQTFVLLMVPDHMFLKATAWNFIGILFGPTMASVESLLILLVIPLLFLYHSLLGPIPAARGDTGAEKRKVRHLFLLGRRKKSLPVFVFIVIILVGWFSTGGETASRMYMPAPRPVIEANGTVQIPLHDPAGDVEDGSLHKFSLNSQGENITILVIKKPDNSMAVCLDACEICPPQGYGLKGDLVICRYCNTPIPVRTLGQPGGCNPAPLPFSMDQKSIKLEMSELLRKWSYVKTGKGREAVK